jgi:O-antigen/teichoic acid export membrane protein
MGSSIIPLITVPILLTGLGAPQYAIWATMTTLINWISLFDFGVGYSLKNRIAEAVAVNKVRRIIPVIAGTMQFYILSSVVLLLLFFISLYHVNVFNDHKTLAILIYIPVIISFPFTMGNFLMQALSRFTLLNFLLLSQGIIWLIVILLNKYGVLHLKLESLGISFSLIYLFVNATIFFIAIYQLRFPLAVFSKWKHFFKQKNTMVSGLRFFILQLASLLLYSVGNILTYDNLDLISVAKYDIINKVFILGITVFNIIISVYWVEISKVKAQNDHPQLLKMRKQLLLISMVFTILSCAAVFIIPLLLNLWTNGRITVEYRYLFAFAILGGIQAFSYSGAVFLNAFENLKGQILFSVGASLCMFPLVKQLFKIGMGINTVPIASAILTIPTLIYVIYKSRNCINQVSK